MSQTGPAIEITKTMVSLSHLPPSMNGSIWLYCSALTGVMCISVLGLSVLCWMIKDSWIERKRVRFNTVLFNFRLMMGLAGTAALVRSLPEVLYLQMYGDPNISLTTQANVMMAKRIADSTGLFIVMGWVSLLVMIYPYVCNALRIEKEDEVITHMTVDDYPALRRLTRPAVCFLTIVLIAIAFTFGKVYGI